MSLQTGNRLENSLKHANSIYLSNYKKHAHMIPEVHIV